MSFDFNVQVPSCDSIQQTSANGSVSYSSNLDDSSIFGQAFDETTHTFDIGAVTGEDYSDIFVDGALETPDSFDGEYTEKENKDGTYTRTYNTPDGKVDVTGTKTGFPLNIFFGDNLGGNYTITHYDKNNNITSEKSTNGTVTDYTQYAYADDGSTYKDFGIEFYCDDDSKIEDFLSNGTLDANTNISIIDYHEDGTAYVENVNSGDGTVWESGKGGHSQTYYEKAPDLTDANNPVPSKGVTYDEYVEARKEADEDTDTQQQSSNNETSGKNADLKNEKIRKLLKKIA